MPKQEAPLDALSEYLPVGSYEMVSHYLRAHKVHLTITKARATVLGDYRNAWGDKNHRITVNGNLNPYSFLVTLLHELAHLLTYMKFGNRVQAHGMEWKKSFSDLLVDYIRSGVFPDDIRQALIKSYTNPAASSCADDALTRVLRKYDEGKARVKLVEELATGTLFLIKGGRVFKKGARVRKRYECVEVKTGKLYLFSPVFEVVPVAAPV